MTLQLPDTLTYGKVIGRFVLAVADVPEDPDALPNAVPAVGTISFTSMNPLTKETAATPPTTVVRSVIPAAIDNNGYLYNPKDPEGPRGIWLVAGPYKVAYSLNTGAIAGHDILVLPEHDDETPLDLISALPPGGPVLTASQYAELSARIDSLEAGGGSGGGTTDHNVLSNRELADQHPMTAITDLVDALSGKSPTSHDHAGVYATSAQGTKADTAVQPATLTGYVPTSRTVNDKPLSANVTLTASDVGAATPQQVTDGDTATLSAAQSHAQGLVDALTAASPATLDTLAEIADALGEDPNFAATMTNALAARVRFDLAQSLTVGEQAQARTNIGAAPALGPDDNYVTDAEKAALHGHANKAALDLVSGENTGDQDLSGYVLASSLGSAATANAGDFATAAQGAKADAAIPSGLVDAKGDLIVATADNTVTRLPASTDGHVLTLDSAESAGVKWAAPSGGSVPLRVVETTASTDIVAASTDHAKLIQLTATTAVDVELPAGVTVGTQIEYQATDTGLATFVLGAGASWRPAPTPSAIMLDTGSAVTAICVAADTWMLVGRLA